VSLEKRLSYVLTTQTPSRLWEPGYRERYYQQKFGVEHTDQEFKKKYGILLFDHKGHAH
jgi:5'-3' exonuclease